MAVCFVQAVESVSTFGGTCQVVESVSTFDGMCQVVESVSTFDGSSVTKSYLFVWSYCRFKIGVIEIMCIIVRIYYVQVTVLQYGYTNFYS